MSIKVSTISVKIAKSVQTRVLMYSADDIPMHIMFSWSLNSVIENKIYAVANLGD